MNVTIRRAHGGEEDRLTAIAQAAKRHWGYPEEYMRLWREDLTISPDFMRRSEVWCAVLDDEVVGFCAVTCGDGLWELDHLWVEPSHHGRGVGTMLLEHGVVLAREQGAAELRIVADPNAVEFYEKRGARLVGSVASVPEGRELPLMELSLDNGTIA